MPTCFSSIEAAVAAIGRGEAIIVVDAEDRENEGDFVCAAEKVSPDLVNFMLRHGRGQVCMPILPDLARRLDLPMMVETNSAPLGTAFTVPVDHVTARTGITAAIIVLIFCASQFAVLLAAIVIARGFRLPGDAPPEAAGRAPDRDADPA